MPTSTPFNFCMEVVKDDGAFEARNERVVILRSVGQFGQEVTVAVYGYGWPGTFKPGDRYDLVKRES